MVDYTCVYTQDIRHLDRIDSAKPTNTLKYLQYVCIRLYFYPVTVNLNFNSEIRIEWESIMCNNVDRLLMMSDKNFCNVL